MKKANKKSYTKPTFEKRVKISLVAADAGTGVQFKVKPPLAIASA